MQHPVAARNTAALKQAESCEIAKPSPSVLPMRCKQCGEVGYKGGYPFSTYPASSRLCDDCG